MTDYLIMTCGTYRHGSAFERTVDKSALNRGGKNKDRYRQRVFQVALVCCMFMTCSTVLGGAEVKSERISADDDPKFHEIRLPELKPNEIGWEIGLQIDDPQALDVDLEIFAKDPRGRFIEPVCLSDQLGRFERCRVNAESLPDGRAWIKVFPAVGVGKTSYIYQVRPLLAPSFERSQLYGSDVMGRFVAGQFVDSLVFSSDAGGLDHLYRIELPSDSGVEYAEVLLVSVLTADRETPIEATIYDNRGRIVKTSQKPASSQLLTVRPAAGREWYLLVKLTSMRSVVRKYVSYAVKVTTEADEFDPRMALESARRIDTYGEPVYIYEPQACFVLNLPSDDLYSLILEGDGYDLSVFPDPYGRYSEESAGTIRVHSAGSSVQYALLGQSFMGSEHLQTSLNSERVFLICVEQKSNDVYGRYGKAMLRVRSSKDMRALRYSLDFSTSFPDKVLYLNETQTEEVSIGQGQQYIYELLWTESVESFRAMLDRSGETTGQFDIALCGEYGQVYEISDSQVSAGREKADRLFLVIFPSPHYEGTAAGSVRLIFEGNIAGKKGKY